MTDPARPRLERTLTLFDGTMIVMGTIIGIGVFFTPSRVAGATGSHGLSLLAWTLGALIALAGGCTYAALGAALPRTGGPYVYLREGCGRLVAFLYGWMLLAAIVSGAIAVIGLVFADHLARFFPLGGAGRSCVAAATIVLLTAVNVLGVRWGSRVQNLFTLLKIASLLLLVAAGLWRGSEPLSLRVTAEPQASSLAAGFISAMVGVLFSFGGWQNLCNVAGELKRPERDLPRAILIGVLGVAAVYLLANFAYLRLLPIEELRASAAPAAAALERAIGERAGDVTALLTLCSAFGILNGLLLSAPRVYYAMAEDGLLFRPFGAVSCRFRTPATAILVQGGAAALLVFWGSVFDLLDYVVFADWLFFTLNALALFVIVRRSRPAALQRGAFGYPWAPALFGLLGAAVTAGTLIVQWRSAGRGVAILAAGALVYAMFLRRGRGGRAPAP
ncbi:MAG: amino acid permease [Planctomycetes bacterium]|nr:amino acid permease [Planctomycetota bacterium]